MIVYKFSDGTYREFSSKHGFSILGDAAAKRPAIGLWRWTATEWALTGGWFVLEGFWAATSRRRSFSDLTE